MEGGEVGEGTQALRGLAWGPPGTPSPLTRLLGVGGAAPPWGSRGNGWAC